MNMLRINSTTFSPSQQQALMLREYVRPGLNIHQLQQIKAIFNAFDPGNTGLLTTKDLKTAIQNQGPEATANPLYQLICDLDKQGQGKISFDQFVRFLTTSVTGQEDKDQYRQMFDLFDDQKTGRITLGGLRRMVREYHLEWEEEDLQEMIKQADLDKSGSISFEEFYQILTYKAALP